MACGVWFSIHCSTNVVIILNLSTAFRCISVTSTSTSPTSHFTSSVLESSLISTFVCNRSFCTFLNHAVKCICLHMLPSMSMCEHFVQRNVQVCAQIVLSTATLYLVSLLDVVLQHMVECFQSSTCTFVLIKDCWCIDQIRLW